MELVRFLREIILWIYCCIDQYYSYLCGFIAISEYLFLVYAGEYLSWLVTIWCNLSRYYWLDFFKLLCYTFLRFWDRFGYQNTILWMEVYVKGLILKLLVCAREIKRRRVKLLIFNQIFINLRTTNILIDKRTRKWRVYLQHYVRLLVAQ